MSSLKSMFALPLLLLLVACGTDYPPVDQTITFNSGHPASFSLSNTATLNQDTTLMATVRNDTSIYAKNGTNGALVQSAKVARLSLQSSDENYTLDKLGTITVLIGPDTVAFDSMPMGTLDTSLVLTVNDISKLLQDSSFTVALHCHPAEAPPNGVTISCDLTVIYTALYSL